MDKQNDGQTSHKSDDVIPNELYACDTPPASSQVDDSQPKSSQCVLPQQLQMILDSALATTASHTKIPPTRMIPEALHMKIDKNSDSSIDVVKPEQPVCAIEHVKPLNPEVQNSDDDKQKKEVENKPRRRKQKNIFTRIDDLNEGPLFMLKMALVERRKIKVWIRSAVHVRSICSGFVQLFDKHMNLAMSDVDETFINPLLVQRKEIRVMPKKKKKKRCPPGTWIPVRGMKEGNPEPHDENQQYFIQTNFSEDDQSSEVQHWALRGIDEGSTPQSQEDLQGHSSSAISELPVENINPPLNLDGTCDSSSDEFSTDPLEQVQDLNDLEALAAKLKQELAECSDSSRQTTDSPVKHSTSDKHHKDKYHHTKDKKCEGSERKDSGNKISGRHKESSSDHYRKSHRRDLSPLIDSAKHRENQEKSRDSGRKHKSSHSPERYHQSDVGRASKSRSSSSAHHSSSHREINVSSRERSRERCSDFDIHATFSPSSHSMSKGRSRESRSSSRSDISYVQADTSRGDSRARSVSLGSNDLRQKLLKRSIKYSLEADKEKLRSSNSTSDCRKSASQERADVSYKATHSKSKSYDDHSTSVGYSKSKDLSDESKYTKGINRSRSKDKTNYSKDKSTSKHCEHKLNDYDDTKTKYQDSNSSKTEKYVSTKRHNKDTERGKGEKKSEKSERTDPSINVTQIKDLSHELDKSTKEVAEYKSKSNQEILRRFVSQLFIRGDNVVMVAFAD